MKTFLIIISIFILILGLVIYYSNKEDEEWAKFSKENNCRIVAQKDGYNSTGYGVDNKGNFITFNQYNSSKKVYLCDDGITYEK